MFYRLTTHYYETGTTVLPRDPTRWLHQDHIGANVILKGLKGLFVAPDEEAVFFWDETGNFSAAKYVTTLDFAPDAKIHCINLNDEIRQSFVEGPATVVSCEPILDWLWDHCPSQMTRAMERDRD
jgi:hypothetical protein